MILIITESMVIKIFMISIHNNKKKIINLEVKTRITIDNNNLILKTNKNRLEMSIPIIQSQRALNK